MKLNQIFLLLSLGLTAFSPMKNSTLYDQGYTVGTQLGSSETYPSENAQLVQNTLNLPLDPEYFEYKMGVLEGYLVSKFRGACLNCPTAPTPCFFTYWDPVETAWKSMPCNPNIE